MDIQDKIKTEAELAAEAMMWWSPKDAATYFKVCPGTIYSWIHDGCIKADEVSIKAMGRPGKYLIHSSELDRIDREMRTVEIMTSMRKKAVRMIWRRDSGKPF